MPSLAIAPILKAMKAALAQPTEANIFALADAANLTIKKESLKIEVVEYTTKKGKVIRGVVRTDLSYSEAKAIDEYTFKKDGGWFIREKHLTNEPILAGGDTPPDNEPQSAVIESVQTDNLVNDADNNIEGLTRKFKPAAKKYKNPEIKLDTKEGVKLLKKTLTKLFPNTKFKVNMSRGTAYGSVNVSWVDGASYDLVDVIARHFKGSGFDGMTDSSHSLYALNEDGKVVDYGLGYVSISRGYSREFLEKLKLLLPDHFQKQMATEGVTIKGVGDGAYFDAKENWTRDKLRDAMISYSTGHYGFVKVKAKEADIEPSNEQPKSSQVQNSHQELADTLKMFGWKIEPFNNQKGDIFASKDIEVKYKDKLIKAKATLRNWLENTSLTAYADELVLKNDYKATIDTSQFWKVSPVEQKQIISDLETALRSFLIAKRERFSQADSQSSQVVTIQEPQPKTNQMPSLMQDATGLDPAIKDMVKEYYDLVHDTYVDEALAHPTLENWERKEYQQVKDKNIKRKDELEKHLNETVLNYLGIDWTGFYKQLSPTNEAPPTYTPKGENNVPSTSRAMESNSNNSSGTNQKQSAENGNANESGELGRLARPPVNGLDARGGSERDSGLSLPKNDGIGIGARGDTSVSDGAGERGVGASNTTTKSSGSSRTNESRTPINRERDSAIVRTSTRAGSVTQTAKEAEQLKAEGTPTQWGDAQNIDKALPYLLPEQRDDVAKLEKRLIEENKNGILFTNGTGTGKTFTGLGAVKRFANAGKKNILIVSMNDKIIRDFIKSAKSLNLDVHQLDGITDNGKDKIVATTYANMAQNNTLGMRDWDLIVVDEAHNLMQGEQGKGTDALDKLRALSGHYAGFEKWFDMRHGDKNRRDFAIGIDEKTRETIFDEEAYDKWWNFKESLRDEWRKTWSEQPKGRTKVIFLTATPFSYVKTLDWAEGYLFDFVPPAEKFSNKTDTMGLAYNSGNPYERFYMSNFGYKMRYNRLTRPNGRVDVGILERKFAEKLKTEGAMSGRELSVPFDYDRKFVLVNSKIGEKIDEGFRYLWDTKDKDGKSKYSDLLRAINKRFDYLARLQLLEAIKAEEAIGQIKKHLALGRKVIVFHDYNVGGSTNPFILKGSLDASDAEALETQYSDFKKERPDLINLKLDIPAPLVTLRRAFPNSLMFNGTVSKGQRAKNADLFNSDDSGFNVMIAQSDAAATGISFHDTTGKHQRVIINIGMPTKPAKLRQTEGRIYRVGQASNAIQRYLTTGTGWERSAFAQKIAERAETVDNLAQGESAVVSIKDALVRAYEEAEYFEPSENDGVGGKAYDAENSRINALSPFERAKSDYWVKQKITAKRGEREGKEWYATPEPVGLFMVNLAGAHSGDDILEPSAGDGAIGRYMPSDASVTFIEPSDSLASRARMNNTNANVIIDDFENHNSSNKYDAIVMNPPFGQGGSIAIKHLIKSFEHLRDGGRVVALLPVGKMDELIADYQVKGYFKEIYTVAEFTLPSSTFENAGTRVNTKIHVFEKHENKADAPQGVIVKNLSHYDNIEDLFNAIENINIKPRKPRLDEALAEYGIEIYPNNSKYIVTGEGLKRIDITATLFSSYDKKNSDGDYVEKYNRGSNFLRWLKGSNIPTMAQFNQGLSANNLPIRYQDVRGRRHNTWDGVGDKPYWLEQSMRYGAKLEDFAVEKPVYDAVSGIDPKAILAAMRQALDTPSDENIQALAREAGLKIKPVMTDGFVKKGASRYEYIIWGVPKDESLEELLFTQNQKGEVIATIKKAQDIKALLEEKYGVTKARIQTVDLGGGFDFSADLTAKDMRIAVSFNDAVASELAKAVGLSIKKPTPNDEKGLLIAKLKQEIQALYAENTKKDQNRSKTSYKAKIASNSAFSSMVRHIDKKEAIIRYVENGFKLSRWDVIDFLGETIFYLTASEKVKLLQGSSSGYTMDFRQLNIAIFYLEEKLNKDYQREVKRLNIKDDNAVSQTKKIKKYKSGTREWQNFCHDESIKYARLYHSYMNDKLDYDNFIKKKELSPLSDDSIKDIENVVMRNSNKWREIDIVQFDLKPEYLENNRLDDTNHFDDIGGFTPTIDLDQTLKAIKETLANGSHDNIKRLATLAGLTLKEPEPDSNKLNAQEQAVMDVMLKSGIYNFATLRDNNDFSKLADFSNEEFDTVGLILEDTKKELTKKVVKHILENSTDYPNAIGKNMVANSDLDGMDIAPLAKLAKIKKTAKTPDDLFKLMASSTANQDVRYYLTGVKVEDNGDLISTDGHSMTIIRDSGINREAGIYTTTQRLEGLKRALLKQGKNQEEIDKEIKAQEDSFKEHKFPDYKRVYPNKRRFAAENILKIDVAKLKGIVDSIVKAFRRAISNKFFGINLEFNQNEIVFNVQYLQNGLDLMASMGYKQVNLYLQEDARSPMLIEPEDEKVSFVVMPMVDNRNYKAIKTINLNNLDDWNWSKSNFDDIDTEDDEDFEDEDISQLSFF